MSGALSAHAGPVPDEGGRDRADDAFGFWAFLMSDAVIFALLFAVYGTALGATAGGPTAAAEFKLGSAFVETLLLLTSSLTFGLAMVAVRHDGAPRPVLAWMAVTLALGIGFLVLEAHDFATMFGDGAYPTRSGFLSAFFALVPLHGLHVLAGSLWIAVMAVQIGVFGLDARVRTNLLRLSLFWHFLDVIWIAIFSVVYLQAHLR